MNVIQSIKEINLAGIWDFIPEGMEKTSIIIPGGGWQKQGSTCEAAVYQTRITIPDAGLGRQATRLELGAVNHVAEYYLGEFEDSLVKIYEEVTAFTPQAVDLTPHVQPGRTYVLQIHVRSHRDGRPIAPHWAEWCDEVIARGIFRDAYIRVYPAIYISDTFVKTSVEKQTLTYDVWVTNTTNEDQSVTLKGVLSSWNGEGWNYPELPTLQCVVPSGGTKKITAGPVEWRLGQESYWWPNVPYREGYKTVLHMLKVTAETNGQAFHKADTRFGFRELKQAGKYFELNGVRVNFRGDNLQVANYDRIDNDGKGDAIDTLPGFLPPSESNPGWPKAVDNFLKLNYNVQRTHMGPWSPYMLDTCDELGLMLLGESACRWDGFDMDNGRGFHEVKCLEDIIRRDKNHPSIVRWSTKNETQSLDPLYHLELYEAVKAIDDTRPIYEDMIVFDRIKFDVNEVYGPLLEKDDFTWIEHYISYKHPQSSDGEVYFTTIQHNDAVVPLADRPFGIGEANWMRSSTPGGLPFFAATTALVRAQDASDVRPYVLLSSWVSSIPGVKTTDLITEENRHPVYGEDNLPDPWSLSGIQLLQKACSPFLAMDYDFWYANRESNAHGMFPIVSPKVQAKTTVTKEIIVFNDDRKDGNLELVWTLREGSTSNWIYRRGSTEASVAPGYHTRIPVTFDTPKFNTFLFLTLEVRKNGVVVFADNMTNYEVIGGEDFRSEFNGEERKFI